MMGNGFARLNFYLNTCCAGKPRRLHCMLGGEVGRPGRSAG
jgi:hypothetical protein